MRDFFKLAAIAVVLFTVSSSFADSHSDGAKQQKAVLITGASSGIGRHATETLAAKGYFVYAGARKQADLDALNAIPNVQAIRLDVTKQDEIDAAVETVRKGGRGLYGLVNNAGIGSTAGPIIEADIDNIRWVLDVNVFGVISVTQAFAPLIMESKGRITTIGSIAGTGAWVGGSDYTMSKHAIEAFSDVLGLEMARFDVRASVIQPGNYRSDISKSNRERRGELTEAQKNSPYADYYTSGQEGSADRSQYKDPGEVSAAIEHALFDPNPRNRYMVVPNRPEAAWTIGNTLRRIAERNEGQEHAFSRDELIAMLDAAIAAENATEAE